MRQAALQATPTPTDPKSFRDVIATNERNLLVRALDNAGGNQSKAAVTLGMKLSTFRDKLVKHGIRVSSGSDPSPR